MRKLRLIIFPKDKTCSTDTGNRTLDPQIQSSTLYRLSQQAPIHMTCCALNAIGEAQPHLPHGSCSKPNFNLMGPKLHRSYSTSEYIAQAPIRYYALYIMIIDTKCNVLNCTELLISLWISGIMIPSWIQSYLERVHIQSIFFPLLHYLTYSGEKKPPKHPFVNSNIYSYHYGLINPLLEG